jgi:hypothetical protein
VAAEEKAAVGAAVHRRMQAQGGVYREGIGIERFIEVAWIE